MTHFFMFKLKMATGFCVEFLCKTLNIRPQILNIFAVYICVIYIFMNIYRGDVEDLPFLVEDLHPPFLPFCIGDVECG